MAEQQDYDGGSPPPLICCHPVLPYCSEEPAHAQGKVMVAVAAAVAVVVAVVAVVAAAAVVVLKAS